jgi:hypothetical protein
MTVDQLIGMPDFGTALTGDAVVAYAAYGGGAYWVLPGLGALADLQLTMIRRADDLSAEGNYAMLDVEVGCDYPLDKALALARAENPGATVSSAPIELGFARLIPSGTSVALPAAMTAPMPLGWARSDGARWTDRLDLTTAELIKGASLGGTLLFGVRIEFILNGVAPRMAAQTRFVPSILIPQLLGGSGQTFLAREDLVTRLSDQSLSPALQTDALRADVAEALADRLLGAFGQFAPAAGATDFPGFTISGPLPAERLDWDLSQPTSAPRAFAIRLDTVSGLSALDSASMVRELTIPPLDLGFRDVALAANLPAPRTGAPAIGVRLSAPPAPPNRPSGINQTVVFTPPDDGGRTTLRFDPNETFAYNLTPFALVAAGALEREIDAPPKPCNDNFVQLQASDFQLVFSHVTASDRLAAAATVGGTLTYALGGVAGSVSIRLNATTQGVAVAMPAGATGASLAFVATTPDGTVAKLPPFPPGRIRLDLSSFPDYGPHRIAVRGAFTGNETPLTLELAQEEGAGSTSLVLTPSAPDATFGYVAASPFKAGYRFRPAGGAWSPVMAPGAALTVDASGAVQENGMFTPSPFEVDGVSLVAEPGPPLTLRYVPAAPTPELSPSGAPTLLIVKSPQTAILQFGVHFELPPDGQTALLAKVAKINPALAGARLQPAMMHVESAVARLADDNGLLAQIGVSSPTSSFPPYAALFNVTLNPDQTAQAMSAVNGRPGVLVVDFTLAMPGSDGPIVKTTDIATWFAAGDGKNHIRTFG